MKKILLTIVCFLALEMSVFAATTTNWNTEASLKRVNTIGQKILTSNKLPTQITFKVSEVDEINAYANANNEIYVYKGLLQYVQDDTELAAVISHEIGHIVSAHSAKKSIYSTMINYGASQVTGVNATKTAEIAGDLTKLKMSRKYEYQADMAAVDLLIGAGYNPLAMISVLNKICGNYMDIIETHPSGDKRTLNIYDYLSYNYPATITKTYTSDSYKSFVNYVTPIVAERKTTPSKMKKYEKTQAKYKKEKLKRIEQMRKSSNPWNTSYTVLQIMSSMN